MSVAGSDRDGNHRSVDRIRSVLRWMLVVAYLFVGIAHLRTPGTFLPIMPGWVPYPAQVILVTGLCEIAGAVALATRRWRYAAGVMLAAYAVCVYPANIKHAVDGVAIGGGRLGWWYHGPRLAFQPVIVWWALFAGRVIEWPWRRRP
ncbi:MAG TPA: hypothetical protein VF649_07110 [Sphingomonas sp.]|jgi:uncharacterized membrane protein|uniref:DoxX family protein n=1 Tax=Sphingomonas sp. TaxID=28214 RepID=UPI002ED9CB7E